MKHLQECIRFAMFLKLLDKFITWESNVDMQNAENAFPGKKLSKMYKNLKVDSNSYIPYSI